MLSERIKEVCSRCEERGVKSYLGVISTAGFRS